MITIEQLYEIFLQHPLISTDTRKIADGCLFFALKGEKFDANTFAKQALETGAAYAIIDNPDYHSGEKYILVNNVLTSLQELARYHRQQLTIPVIGLTGSNGKTTTKELIFSVLSQRYRTLATQGNLNNHIGVPFTILNINSTHEIAVIEMGANHQKEIELLCSIALPTHGLITNIGKAHLEGFGGIEGVKKGKGELYDFLLESESQEPDSYRVGSAEVGGLQSKYPAGVAFVNADSADLMKMQQDRGLKNVVLYGTSGTGHLVSGKIFENAPFLALEWTNHISGESHTIKTQLTGAYNLHNVLAAISTGVYFGLTNKEINKGVENYMPKNNRSQIVKTTTNTLICDYYNANPSSMIVAIDNISNMGKGRKVLILGDMFELGPEAAAEHKAVVEKTMDAAVDERIFIGKEFYALGPEYSELPFSEKKTVFYGTAEDAARALKANPIKNSTILIKGSRGMALERLVQFF
jgi:UDP-N-acetylmuramoyl-tripeptide--D-alanyl-D-alanine ligase